MSDVIYKDRKGNVISGDATPSGFLEFAYDTVPGKLALNILIRPAFSNLVRAFLKSPVSTLMIDRFVKNNNISLRDCVPCRYPSFNDFFIRELKSGKRTIERDHRLLASPCDGKVTVAEINDDLILSIKGTDYTVPSLLRNDELAEEFAGGWAVVLRLTADDYHHYCYPDDGHKGENVFIPGVLHTVSPTATERIRVFRENQREYTVIDSLHFGRFVQIEIGAMCVGRIVNLHGARAVKRGTEKGRFEFGGSTIVLLFKKDCYTPDEDLIANSREGIETVVKLGERIGFNEEYQGGHSKR
ncbi:MAG: phosphatidylserine decarboxylase [Lachnospiraceae bacterium]|nr:phosphatidylserine decarboxylase [Lachnospiraceae bacterium]